MTLNDLLMTYEVKVDLVLKRAEVDYAYFRVLQYCYHKCVFYPRLIPVNYTIYLTRAILSKVKNRFNQDYYFKTYN